MDMNAFMQRLKATPGNAARALEFAIVTGTRTDEVRGAKWGDIDFAAKGITVDGFRSAFRDWAGESKAKSRTD